MVACSCYHNISMALPICTSSCRPISAVDIVTKTLQVSTMAAADLDIEPIIWEIDGYVREMGNELYPTIIPSGINQIICIFYDPVCIDLHNHFVFLRSGCTDK